MKRILLADDEEVLRMLIVDTLEEEGYEIVEAEDGYEALEWLRKDTFDLVILDNMMPGKTGIEVARDIQSLPHRDDFDILMLTAKHQQKDIDESKQAGIQYYMGKPFSPMKLMEVVEEILNA
ncbi:response regulator [Pontibacillus salicampi]|uniref:Response regulator n=1 Tax=Pontibacillus salicampi TaxID=1449801 RepID=A0ABV6LT04_9BACI